VVSTFMGVVNLVVFMQHAGYPTDLPNSPSV
jgi:hypothetical protein